MKFPARQVLAGVAASLAFAAMPAAATVDWFLKLDKIQGESTDDKHKGEIDVLSWSWGVSQATSSGNTGSRAETVSLGFSSVTVEYREQKPDGSLGGTVATTISGGC